MSTTSQSSKVREARQKLGELFQEGTRAATEYQTWLGELVDAVNAHDEVEVNHAFDEAFAHGARLRDIIEEDVADLLDVLVDEDASGVARVRGEERKQPPRQGRHLRVELTRFGGLSFTWKTRGGPHAENPTTVPRGIS